MKFAWFCDSGFIGKCSDSHRHVLGPNTLTTTSFFSRFRFGSGDLEVKEGDSKTVARREKPRRGRRWRWWRVGMMGWWLRLFCFRSGAGAFQGLIAYNFQLCTVD